MIGGLRKRTKLGFGIKKKERDAESLSTQEGDSTASLTKQKLCNATANGFLGDIDWQRYTSPELDADGYSLPPTWQPETRDPPSSSDSDDESSVPLRLNISIRPLDDSPAATPTPGQFRACVRCLPPPPSPLRIPDGTQRQCADGSDTTEEELKNQGSDTSPFEYVKGSDDMTPGITKISDSVEPASDSCSTHHGVNHEEEDKWTVLESHDVERGKELEVDKAVELSFDSFIDSAIHLEHDALGGVKTKTTEEKDTHHPSPSCSLHEDVTDMKEMEAIDDSGSGLPKAPLAREESGSSVASDCSHVATTTNPPLPVAVAITETVHAYFKAKLILQVTGEIIFSFPMEAPSHLATCSAPLTFFLHHTEHIQHPLLRSQILHRVPELDDKANMAFQFDIPALIEQLQEFSRKGQAKNHFNITALKYKVENHEPREAPLILSPHWTYEQAGIMQLTVKYRYNPNAFETPSDLHDVQFVTHVEGDVTSVQATPPAVWLAKQGQITWKLPELQNNNHVTGKLSAKCELKGNPGPPRVLAVRFRSDGASCSGLEVKTGSTSNFKLALVKKSVHSGRYLADACNEEVDDEEK